MSLGYEQEQRLYQIVERWFDDGNAQAPSKLLDAGIVFPVAPPKIYETLPDEWDALMDNAGGITRLQNFQLEDYLEKWTRLLGYAYWLRGVWRDRVDTLERALQYVKDYIFKEVDGGRELRGAEAGSHDVTLYVLDKLNEAKRPLNMLEGKIERWEKIEFAISRAITNRQR
ncbi:hypothetical protein SECTIM467_106 [Brevibacillus phage SecTim467]|uniref:Uncharacterized protein n=2 Tax=Jenstvirus jenst TaxID=1982225 RepID=A0A0K2CNU7_9CAUD|nr:hypothetical protein AVV11_gp090 [Brevibacillus phage Jenst]ALA07230.1 hypothetical protein JENST_101 [Brevibacillus phage Jenst]ALA07446.1 hypothetical protein SECTIM467_106 [Brevibacillus phage SecTim467]